MDDVIEPTIQPRLSLYTRRFGTLNADVWEDARALDAQSRASTDLDTLQLVFERAQRCLDFRRMALAGPTLFAEGRLDRQQIFDLGRALFALGRHEEAVKVLAVETPMNRSNRAFLHLRAANLARAGLREEALDLARRALAADPEFAAMAELRKILKKARKLSRREADLDRWSDIHALAQYYLKLGLEGQAAGLLRRAMAASAELALTAEERLDLAGLALGVCPAEEVATYLALVPHTAATTQRGLALATAASVLAARQEPEPPTQAAGKSLRAWRALAKERRGELEPAIRDLCGLLEDHKREDTVRAALARCVGESVLAEVQPRFPPGRTGRIINLVPFFNEFDLLRLHLEEMAPWVDKFVIVEAGQSFTGVDKPLWFEANQGLFADFAGKIVHQPIRRFPDHLTSPWAREFYQRDMSIAGASGLCGEDDYIIETDVDEVVDHRALDGLEADFAVLDLKLSRYFLNYRAVAPVKAKASIYKARHRARHGVSYGRISPPSHDGVFHVIENAGWHFTSVTDASGIALKVNSYSHQEPAKARFRSAGHFQEILDRLRAGVLEPGWERVELDDSFPAYLRANPEAFADLIL